jgi:hypothetical protein
MTIARTIKSDTVPSITKWELDGGSASSTYSYDTDSHHVDGGRADSIYITEQKIDAEDA